MRQGWKQVALAIAVVAGTGGHDAAAAICFPYAGGVPGESGSGPPDWWSATAGLTGTDTTTYADDPRWHGAFADIWHTKEKFRVLVERNGSTDYLVMSWVVTGDPGSSGDQLYFGVWDDSTSTGNIYQLTRNRSTATTVPGGSVWTSSSSTTAFTGRIFGGAVVSGSPVWTDLGTALPTWLTDNARVDVSSCSSPTVCDTWVFRVRAKIRPGGQHFRGDADRDQISTGTPRTFHFWYEIQDDLSIGTSLYRFPTGLAAADGSTASFPDPSGWKAAQLGYALSCDGDILFDSSDVYVNSSGSTQLDFTSNTFYATPKNNIPSSSISNSNLTARFRIANWGSAGYLSPEWHEVCTASGSGALVTYPNDFNRSCTWTISDPCPYKPAGATGCGSTAGTKDRHQCVLVDLDVPSTSTQHYTFSAQSVFQNMDFDVNSTLVRQATIDIKGLGPMPGGAANRDVYLYIHTNNMPAKIGDEPAAKTAGDQGADQRVSILPPRQRFKDLPLPATGAIGTQDSARIQAALTAGRLTQDQVAQIMPTYIVYVWHDTGRTLATAGGPKKLLEDQPSFGLFLAHDGPIEGWKHELTAAGAVQVGPNLYKISAPNDSTFPVTITIQPVCTGPVCWPIWVWILVALGLLLLLIVLYLLFRKKPPPAPPGP